MTINAPDYRINPFTGVITSFGHGYSGNPKEVHVIPSSSPYYVFLNEIPRDDSPSTLLVNEQGGSSWTEVSFSTSPAAGQFRAVYGGTEAQPISIVGQGTIEFNSADAGKTMEFSYYGMGAIVQNQIFNKILDGFYGTPEFANGLKSDTISELTAAAGLTIESILLKDGTVNSVTLNGGKVYQINDDYTATIADTATDTHDYVFGSTGGRQGYLLIVNCAESTDAGMTAAAAAIVTSRSTTTGKQMTVTQIHTDNGFTGTANITITTVGTNTVRIQITNGVGVSENVNVSCRYLGIT